MTSFNTVDLIQRKRDKEQLSSDEISWLISSYTDGTVTDYQMAAMAMAVFLNGLDEDELTAWTGAMLNSGDVLNLSDIPLPKIDKHSTGGVGDKVSIPLVPIVAACGVAVPMISGRGLGHTGGTLDKLESIPGFVTQLDPKRFHEILKECGLVMAGQSQSLVPADRKLYALRDATGTVESVPLIASSIMSKKMAENLDGLVLDVKVGSGAFMTDIGRARHLARTMVSIGAAHGVSTTALITDMNQPLGRMVGNSNEITESIDVIAGGGPPDLVEMTRALAMAMLEAAHIDDPAGRIDRAISSGRAMEKFQCMVAAHGGNPAVVENRSLLPMADQKSEITAHHDGFVSRCDARAIGLAAMRLGAGRERKEDDIDPGVGIELRAKVGDEVAQGQVLAIITHRPGDVSDAKAMAAGAWTISDEAEEPHTLVYESITSTG